MNGFTTTATLSELIDKRPIKKKKIKRTYSISNKINLKSTQRIMKIKKI